MARRYTARRQWARDQWVCQSLLTLAYHPVVHWFISLCCYPSTVRAHRRIASCCPSSSRYRPICRARRSSGCCPRLAARRHRCCAHARHKCGFARQRLPAKAQATKGWIRLSCSRASWCFLYQSKSPLDSFRRDSFRKKTSTIKMRHRKLKRQNRR